MGTREAGNEHERPIVLVADDDPSIGRLLGRWLGRGGLEVIVVEDGRAALEVLSTSRELAVLILDLQMPGLDGWRALPQARALRPNLPIVVYSSTPEDDYARLEELGACRCVPKTAPRRLVGCVCDLAGVPSPAEDAGHG